jgi:predicted amidohydrolase YtcJ
VARRVADSGAVAVVSPILIHEVGDDLIHYALPGALDVIALGSLLDAGAAVSGSSDFPVSDYDVLRAVSAAVTRTTAGGRVLQAREAVTVQQALELYTTGAAQALGVADHAGRVTPGFDADFVVLGGDPLRTDPAAIADLPVCETWRRGERVYSAELTTSTTGTAP